MLRRLIFAVMLLAMLSFFSGCASVGSIPEVEHYGYTGALPGKCTSCQ